MSQNLQLNAGTLTNACYPSNPQDLYLDMFANGSALMGDITGILIQPNAPDPEDRDKAWIPTTGLNGPPTYAAGPFIWNNGSWLARHPSAPSGSERRLWVGAEAALTTYDGGDGGAAGDTSGPMWEVDHEFNGRVPIGDGAIPDSNPAASAVVATNTDSNGGTGAYTRTLTRANLPNESLHLFTAEIMGEGYDDTPDGTQAIAYRLLVDSDAQSYNMAAGTSTNPTVGKTDALGSGTSFVQAPPFRGIFFIRRTSRVYYRAA